MQHAAIRLLSFSSFLHRLVPPEELFQKTSKNDFAFLYEIKMLSKFMVEHPLKSNSVQELIHRNDLKFDLVIVEEVDYFFFLLIALTNNLYPHLVFFYLFSRFFMMPF